MRDVKVVAYGELDEDDERLITNYLEEKGLDVKILSVDTQGNRIRELEARIVELEKDDDRDPVG